jgi:KAP family P-loop domain
MISATAPDLLEEVVGSESEIFWASDHLDRRQEVQTVIQYLVARLNGQVSEGSQRNFVLNVDAPWGSGKSFFLRGLETELKSQGYLVAFVNAWETDNVDDPIIPILLEIQRTLDAEIAKSETGNNAEVVKTLKTTASYGAKLAIHLGKGAAKALGRRFLADALETLPEYEMGTAANDLTDSAKDVANETLNVVLDKMADSSLSALQQQMDTTRDFKQQLSQVISTLGETNEKKRQLIVLVDELDRCRPNYAVTLLERVKHIFETPGMAFVVATDTGQLQHSVKAIYGNGFDSESYLNRFFMRKYHLKTGALTQLVEDKTKNYAQSTELSMPPGFKTISEFISSVFAATDITARDCQQCLNKIDDFKSLWPHKADIELGYLLPLIVLHHQSPTQFVKLATIGKFDSIASFNAKLSMVGVDFGYTFVGSETRKLNGSLLDIWQSFNDVIGLDFNEINQRYSRSNEGGQGWVRERLRNENMKMRGGSFISNSPPRTVLSGYAKQIMSLDGFS